VSDLAVAFLISSNCEQIRPSTSFHQVRQSIETWLPLSQDGSKQREATRICLPTVFAWRCKSWCCKAPSLVFDSFSRDCIDNIVTLVADIVLSSHEQLDWQMTCTRTPRRHWKTLMENYCGVVSWQLLLLIKLHSNSPVEVDRWAGREELMRGRLPWVWWKVEFILGQKGEFYLQMGIY
jgi:hypothetical protein